jgi:hypothetical protein
VIELVIKTLSPSDILTMVDDLKNNGFKIHDQFDFEYHASNHNDFSGESAYVRYTIFRFYDEQLATWFSLRNGQYL